MEHDSGIGFEEGLRLAAGAVEEAKNMELVEGPLKLGEMK